MKKSIKYFGLAFGLLTLVGCTKNFCTNSDKANMLMSSVDETAIVKGIEEQGIVCPTENFNDYIEYKVYEYATTDISVNMENFGVEGSEKKLGEYTIAELKTAKGYNANKEEILFEESSYYANIKYAGHDDKENNVSQTLWYNFDSWTNEIRNEVHKSGQASVNVFDENNAITTITVTNADLPTTAYISAYKDAMDKAISSITACITPSDGIYDGIFYEGKSWKDAFGYGIIEGLLKYPIAWTLHSLYNLFNLGAVGAILSILIVTVAVRLFILAISFKSTIAQTKMQELQPELNALQAKYPNSNTDQYQKRMLAQAQADLYKKHKINPFASLIVMLFQFPIFISVWGAMSGTAILQVDTLFENGGSLFALKLSENMNSAMFSTANGFSINISAVILFILMSAAQILSTKLPMWLQKREQNKAPKLGKNPAQDQSGKQMNMVSNVMMIMIIFMGFTLPVGMAIYWFISAIISLAQSLIVRAIGKAKKPKSQYAKYKTKK